MTISKTPTFLKALHELQLRTWQQQQANPIEWQAKVRRIAEAESKLAPEHHALTIADLFAALKTDYEINHRKSTRNIVSSWDLHLKEAFGEMPAELVTSEMIGDYVVRRQQEKAASASINLELSMVKRMFNLAIRANRIAKAAYVLHLSVRNVRKGFLKDEDYSSLARETARIGPWLAALFEIGFSFGWRKSELLKMRCRQIDLREKRIVLEAGETKNEDARQVWMTPKIYELLVQCVAGKGTEDFVFTRACESNGRKTKLPGASFASAQTIEDRVATQPVHFDLSIPCQNGGERITFTGSVRSMLHSAFSPIGHIQGDGFYMYSDVLAGKSSVTGKGLPFFDGLRLHAFPPIRPGGTGPLDKAESL